MSLNTSAESDKDVLIIKEKKIYDYQKYKPSMLEYNKNKYATDLEFREKHYKQSQEYLKNRRLNDPEFRERMRLTSVKSNEKRRLNNLAKKEALKQPIAS